MHRLVTKIHLIKISLKHFYLFRLGQNFDISQNIKKTKILYQINLKICSDVLRIY